MATTAKTKYTATQLAWIKAYVAKHGPLTFSVSGHAAAMAGDGTVTIEDRPEIVTMTLLLSPLADTVTAIGNAAPGWIDAYIARGVV